MEKTRNYNNDIEMTKLLLDEWKYRLSQFWSLTIKTVIISLILILLPLMYKQWGVDITTLNDAIWVLSLIGAVFSALVCPFTTIEIRKINLLKTYIRESVTKISPMFSGAFSKRNKAHQHLPIVICAIQVLLAIMVIIVVNCV